MIDFWFGLACGMLINLIISWIAPGPLPRAKVAQVDNHLYLHEGPRHITIIRGHDRDKLRALAHHVINGHSLTFEAIAGKGRLFTVDQWKDLRQQLRDREYWDLPAKGPPIVTEKGKILFDQMARGG